MSAPFLRKKPRKLTRFASIVAVCVTLELLTRWFRPDSVLRVQFDKDLGYRFRSNLNEIYTDREASNTYLLRTNSLGFRGPEWDVPKPADVVRIAVLGNSFIEARSYAEEQTFCGLLERQLHSGSTDGRRFEVMNFGIGGNNTPGEMRVYQKYASRFEPDVVLLCSSVVNDIAANSKRISQRTNAVYWQREADETVPFTTPTADPLTDFRNKSQFYVWQKYKVQQAVNSFLKPEVVISVHDPSVSLRQVKLENALALTQTPLDERYAESWFLYPALLDMFRSVVELDGAEFLIVNLPEYWQVDPEDVLADYALRSNAHFGGIDQPERQLIEMANELGLTFVDLTERFRLEDDRGEHPLFIRGAGHFSERGHIVVAGAIHQFLKQNSRLFQPAANAFAERPRDTTIR